MKIESILPQPILPKQAKKGHAADVDVNVVKQQQTEAKQALRDAIQRQIAEILAARTDKGEDDPRAQLLIDKFKSGKKLTSDEMAYVRQNAPGVIDYIDRISREREIFEQSMRIAPSKIDVQMVVLNASKHISKHQSSEESFVRAMQIADAQYEYMKTDEYKDKPNSPLDKREKPASPRAKESPIPIQYTTMAIIAYELAKSLKRETNAHAMKKVGSHNPIRPTN